MRAMNHLILLCETQEGYQNLTKLVSEGWTRGFYYRPRVDYGDCCKKYSKGLIAVERLFVRQAGSGCCWTVDFESACAHAREMESIFGKGHYFVEIMDHDLEDEKRVVPLLVQVSRETGIPLLATNDCHYLRREDADAQEVLMCIQTGKTLDDDQPHAHGNPTSCTSRAKRKCAKSFPNTPMPSSAQRKLRKRCHVDFDFGETKLPALPHRGGRQPASRCSAGCAKKGLPSAISPSRRKRATAWNTKSA